MWIAPKPDIMKNYLKSFTWYEQDGYAYGTKSRCFAWKGQAYGVSRLYAPENASFAKKGDTMKIKFIWNETECSLDYIINGIDAGNAITTDEQKRPLNDKTNEYRLAAYLMSDSIMIQIE